MALNEEISVTPSAQTFHSFVYVQVPLVFFSYHISFLYLLHDISARCVSLTLKSMFCNVLKAPPAIRGKAPQKTFLCVLV